METECECPVCAESFTLEIEDPDAGSQAYECSCGACFEVSYTVTVEVDGIEVNRGVTAEYECPRCGDTDTLDITEESGDEEVECICGVTLSVSWSSWGREATAEVTGATIDYDCSECGDSSTWDITEESGQEEVECDSCESTLSLSWSNWGESVDVQTLVGGDGDDEEDEDLDVDDEDEDEDDDEDEDEDEDEEEDELYVTEDAWA